VRITRSLCTISTDSAGESRPTTQPIMCRT
jgi:hypothetical protein